jgi:hypothetical protein
MKEEKSVKLFFSIIIISFMCSSLAHAQKLPSGVRSMGSLQSEIMEEKKQKSIIERVEKEREKPSIEEKQQISSIPEIKDKKSPKKETSSQ